MTIHVGFGLTIENTTNNSTATTDTTGSFFDSMMGSMVETLEASTSKHWKEEKPSLWGKIKKLF